MFDSTDRLHDDVAQLLRALRALAGGRYAILFDAKGPLLESPSGEDEPADWTLRRFVADRAATLFQLPAALHGTENMEDVFADWSEDEFFLAFVNGKVALLVACPDAGRVEKESGKLLRILADRLLRLNPGWRLDEKGRGLFVKRPRLDTIVVGRAAP